MREPPDVTRRRSKSRVVDQRLRDSSSASTVRWATAHVVLRAGGPAQRAERAGRGGGRACGRRQHSTRSPRACVDARRSRPARAASTRAERRAADRRHLQRQSRLACAPASRCAGGACPATRWLVLGEMAELGAQAARAARRDRRARARSAGVTRLLATRRAETRTRSRPSVRAAQWFARCRRADRRAATRAACRA